ncbi:MAG: hypothetical protein ACLGHP_00905 [Vicinamibacteria bacterium]
MDGSLSRAHTASSSSSGARSTICRPVVSHADRRRARSTRTISRTMRVVSPSNVIATRLAIDGASRICTLGIARSWRSSICIAPSSVSTATATVRATASRSAPNACTRSRSVAR